ncbi:MAG: sigma-70 family RNA polymerase sigma factor [Pirellula sp.]
MSEPSEFHELLVRVARGDNDAANTLVREYEPTIRRVIRMRLANLPLQSEVDSMDICQSVMASFFARHHRGGHHFQSPNQLIALLATMARSKIAAQSRRSQAKRRDRRRLEQATDLTLRLPCKSASPSQQVEAKELLSQVMGRLTDDERALAKMRSDGLAWDSIFRTFQPSGAYKQTTADSLRKRLTRAIDRVVKELHLEVPR